MNKTTIMRPRLRFFLVDARSTRGLSPRMASDGQSATPWKQMLSEVGFRAGDEVVLTLVPRARKR
jgi:hypothetical protein